MSLQRSVAANFLASGWAALMGLAFIPLYIRYLGIESYGLIGFFATLQAWLFLLDMGVSPGVNRALARYSAGADQPEGIHDLVNAAEIVYAATAVFIALAVAGLSPLIASFWLRPQSLSPDTVGHAVLIMGLAVACQWMATLYRSALLGLQHQLWLSVATAGAATARGAGAVLVLAYLSPTISAFLAFQCIVGAIESATLGWYLRRKLAPSRASKRFRAAALRSISGFAMGVSVVMVLGTLLTQLDKLLLARLLPLDQFAYFALAVAVAGALAVLITPINNVAYPRLSELAAGRDETGLAKQYHQLAQLLSISILPPAMVLCLFGQDVILLWTGDAATARAAGPLLSVWVVGTALNGLMHLPYAAQLAHGWPRLSALLNVIAVLFMIPAVLFLVPRHGAIAAAWIWVTVNVGYMVFGIAAMHRRILVREKWSWYWSDIVLPACACACAAMGMWLLHGWAARMPRMQQAAFLLAGTGALAVAAAAATPLGRQLLRAAVSALLGRGQPPRVT